MLSQKRKDEVVDICRELISHYSVSGQEEGVVKSMRARFEKMGFDDIQVDKYGNIIGHIKGNRPGKKILLDGHIDVVPVPDKSKWSHDPFAGEIANGKIYGRGTSDMKGQVSAMLAAASYFGQDMKKDFAGDIYVAGVVEEELFEGVTAREISKNIKPDYVVIGECSDLNLKIGQRGRAEIIVETFGVPAHSANPEKGVNAVYKMSKFIAELQNIAPVVHPKLGKGILVLTDVKSSPYPGSSVVPDYCRATIDRRLLVDETLESVIAPVQAIADKLIKEDPEMKIKVSYSQGKETCYTGETVEATRFFPGWLYEEKDEFVQLALKGLQGAGLSPKITEYSFCTNGSHYAGEAGIPTIGFGPSKENLAHTIDEHIVIADLHKGVEGYYGILKSVYNK